MQLQANVAKPRRDVGELLKLCAILGTPQLWNTHERNRETTWLVILCVACIAMAALLASMIARASSRTDVFSKIPHYPSSFWVPVIVIEPVR